MVDVDRYFGWYSEQRALGDHGGMGCSTAADGSLFSCG
jgi:hypothetical protein